MTLCVASSGRFFMSRTVPPFSVRPVKWNRPVPVNANRPDRPDFASSTGHRRKNEYQKIPCKKNRTSSMAYGAGYRHFGDFPPPAGIRFMGDCRDSGPVPATAWRWAKSVDSLSPRVSVRFHFAGWFSRFYRESGRPLLPWPLKRLPT